jgi:molybdate transport system substrate-binding protein
MEVFSVNNTVFRTLLFLSVCLLSFSSFFSSLSFASGGDVYVAVSPGIARCVENIYASFVDAGGGKLVFVKETTGPLAQKMDAGAPFAVLVAADPGWPKWLHEKGKLKDMQVCARGHLVLWAEKEELCSEEKLGSLRIASPDPETTSHGALAAAYLKSHGIWEKKMESQALVITKNALHAVMSVQAGSTDVALIPESLAIEVGGFRTRLPVSPHPTVGGLSTSFPSEVAEAFWKYLLSSNAAPLWKKWGFEPAEAVR